MKVVVNTPELLIARHQPVLLPLLLTFVATTLPVLAFTRSQPPGIREYAAIAIGTPLLLFAAWLTNKSSHFRFEARKRRLRWHRRDPWSTARGDVALDDILDVIEESQHDSQGRSYRVALKTAGGRIPLTAHYSTVEPHDRTVEEIRAWLSAERTSSART